MKYLTFTTTSLVTLAGRNDKDAINWDALGTSADLINLTSLRNSVQETGVDGTTYFLPVGDETKANAFIAKCSGYGISAEMIEQAEAESRINAIVASQAQE